jgi:hypothetical protein
MTEAQLATLTEREAAALRALIDKRNVYLGIGSGWNGTIVQNQRPVLGRMYAAFFINRVLTDDERDDVNAWLRAKAGI